MLGCGPTQESYDKLKAENEKIRSECTQVNTELELIQNFIDSSDAIILLKDEQGRYLMVNRRKAENHKLSKEELIGKTDYDILPMEEADKFRAHDRKVIETGTPIIFKDTLDLPSGQIRLIDHKFPVSIEGSPNGVGTIAIDITETE